VATKRNNDAATTKGERDDNEREKILYTVYFVSCNYPALHAHGEAETNEREERRVVECRGKAVEARELGVAGLHGLGGLWCVSG
jgi:hypothetical protein